MKNKVIFLSIVFTALSSLVFSQKKQSAIDKFSNSVVYLHDVKIEKTKIEGIEYEIYLRKLGSNQIVPKNFRVTGTGFFVMDDISMYLITAEHVAKEMTLNTDIVIQGKNNSPYVKKLNDLLLQKDTLIWSFHEEADVAVISLNPESPIIASSLISSIPLEIIEIDRIPERERDVTIIGFPMNLGFRNEFSPISKISKPSSSLIELPRFDNKKMTTFFLLDDPSISGFSGSPVFEFPANVIVGDKNVFVRAYCLMGLIHGSINEKNGGGFAAVVPSKYILETIDLAPKYSGEAIWRYENGNIWSERIYKNGKPWSVINNYSFEGKKQDAGNLKDGSGTLYIYDEKSVLLVILTFENGNLIKTENFDEKK